MAYEHLNSGDVFQPRASDWNAAMDAARAYAASRGGIPTGGAPAFGEPGLTVLIKNASGADRAWGDILGLDSMVYGPADNLTSFRTEPVFAGVTPAVASHVGRFAVLLGPIADGALGRAQLVGPVAVQIHVANEDCAGCADVTNGQVYLSAGAVGSARVLWRETGTGVKWAYLLLGTTAGEVATPYEMLPALADRGLDEAQTDTWARDNLNATTQVGTVGVSWMGPRVIYDAAGTKVVREYTRVETKDSAGRTASFSAEATRDIDAPEVCP
jgi:hypothetical protein